MKNILCLILAFAVVSVSVCHAQQVEVTGGETSIFLDAAELASVGLAINSYSAEVNQPSNKKGGDWIGFDMNGRDHATRPTTFVHELFGLTPTTGTVEHTGSAFFSNGLVIGDFSIGFNSIRTSATNSGFFVQNKVQGTPITDMILFDITVNPFVSSVPGDLTVEGQLFASPELAGFLDDPNLAAGDAAGFISINGLSAIPEPTSLAFIGLLGIAPLLSRRRRLLRIDLPN